MKTIFLIIAIALVSTSAMAHNPLTAKFELNAKVSNGAILTINTSQTGVHAALIKYFDQTDFTTISQNDYKKLIVEYLKEHISILADQVPLEIGEGGIKLGHHQTDLKFLIENYPSEVQNLEFSIKAFQENENHHSVFWWKTIEGQSKKVLSAKNNFQGSFISEEGQYSVLSSKLNTNNLKLILSISISAMLLGGIWFFRYRN